MPTKPFISDDTPLHKARTRIGTWLLAGGVACGLVALQASIVPLWFLGTLLFIGGACAVMFTGVQLLTDNTGTFKNKTWRDRPTRYW